MALRAAGPAAETGATPSGLTSATPPALIVLLVAVVAATIRLRRRVGVIGRALQEAEARCRGLMDNWPDLIARYDRDCRRVYVNRGVERAYGVPREQLIDRAPTSPDDVLGPRGPDPASAALLRQKVHEVFEHGSPTEFEVAVRTLSGDRQYHTVLVPELDQVGRVADVLALGRDITRGVRECEQQSRACCTTPILRCTSPRTKADADGSPRHRPCMWPRRARSPSRPCCAGPWNTGNSSCTTSPWSSCAAARSWRSRPCCAGSTPSTGWSCRGTSSTSPSNAGSSVRSAPGSWTPPAPRPPGGTGATARGAPALAINVSSWQLGNSGLAAGVSGVLAACSLPPDRLCLEITESQLLAAGMSSTTDLRTLTERGVRVAVDDFGTGYTGVEYLRRLPVGELKIDKSFIDGVGADPTDTAITASLVALGLNLGLTVVAEGIETSKQLQTLLDMGCTWGQSRLWHPALPSQDVDALLAARSPGGSPWVPG